MTKMGCSLFPPGGSLRWELGRANWGFARKVGAVLPRSQTPTKSLSMCGEPAQGM